MGVNVPFKLGNTYVNVGISLSYNVNRGDFFFLIKKIMDLGSNPISAPYWLCDLRQFI